MEFHEVRVSVSDFRFQHSLQERKTTSISISDFRLQVRRPLYNDNTPYKSMDTQERKLTFLDFDCERRLRNCSRRNRQALKSVESRNKPFQNTSISWFRSSPSKSTLESLHSETTIVPSFCFEIDKIH